MSEGLNRTTENVVLCGANSYEQKYYFNPDFAQLPESIRNELQMMCVTFAEEAGGIFTVEFDEKGNIKFTVRVDDAIISLMKLRAVYISQNFKGKRKS